MKLSAHKLLFLIILFTLFVPKKAFAATPETVKNHLGQATKVIGQVTGSVKNLSTVPNRDPLGGIHLTYGLCGQEASWTDGLIVPGTSDQIDIHYLKPATYCFKAQAFKADGSPASDQVLRGSISLPLPKTEQPPSAPQLPSQKDLRSAISNPTPTTPSPAVMVKKPADVTEVSSAQDIRGIVAQKSAGAFNAPASQPAVAGISTEMDTPIVEVEPELEPREPEHKPISSVQDIRTLVAQTSFGY